MEYTLDGAIEAIKNDIAALGQHIVSLTKTLKGQSTEGGNSADKSTQDVKDYLSDLQSQGESVGRSVVDHVQAHPARSVVIALGVGFLAAAVIQHLASRDQRP